jgi:hypothetical protein
VLETNPPKIKFSGAAPPAMTVNSFPKLSFACPIPWADLRGDERARFCEKCNHTIVNFSELTEAERLNILENRGPGKLCVTYHRRLSGEYVTPENPLTAIERSHIGQLGVAALSAGALALAVGCTTTGEPPKTHISLSPAATTQSPAVVPVSPPPETNASSAPAGRDRSPPAKHPSAAELAKYDTNKNAVLDPSEAAAMELDLAQTEKIELHAFQVTSVAQVAGMVAEIPPEQVKRSLDREIQRELNKESADPRVEPYSAEGWQKYWAKLIYNYRNPTQIGGYRPPNEDLVRYVVDQRRRFGLPELESAISKPPN